MRRTYRRPDIRPTALAEAVAILAQHLEGKATPARSEMKTVFFDHAELLQQSLIYPPSEVEFGLALSVGWSLSVLQYL
jgi:hypothetical protein